MNLEAKNPAFSGLNLRWTQSVGRFDGTAGEVHLTAHKNAVMVKQLVRITGLARLDCGGDLSTKVVSGLIEPLQFLLAGG